MIETTICGIPCQVEITSIDGRFVPAKINADPNSCYEAEYPEIYFDVLDRKGYKAPWLERKMSDRERERIEGELLAAL